jgi:1-acyl-sn-glycerol-3-phosphate acyltransferase
MRWITGIPSYMFKLWFGLWFYATLLLLYPFFRLTMLRPQWLVATFRLKQLWSMLLQLGLLSILHTRRQKQLPQPAIFVSNHCSYLDIVFMYQVVRQPFIFMGKDSLLKWPLFGDFFRHMDIPVDRDSRVSSARALIKARRCIEQGWSVAIFPEGTIPPTAPVMIDFRDGAFKLAVETGRPVVPITWLNNAQLFSDPDNRLGSAHPGVVKAIVHPPVDPAAFKGDYVSLSRHVRQVIESPLQARYPSQYASNR